MIVSLHGISTMHSNLATDIRIAREADFDALDLEVGKLLRYLQVGLNPQDLLPVFEKHKIKPVVVNCLKSIERNQPAERAELMREAKQLCEVAYRLGCPTMQVVALGGVEGLPWQEVRALVARNLAGIADLANSYGVRLQFEPVAWTPIHSLAQSLEIIESAARDNIGLVIDFWHLWSNGKDKPDDVAKLSSSQIYAVHLCDGIRNQPSEILAEEMLRGYLPGDGSIPIQEWVDAVRATGFDGVWSNEVISPQLWESDLLEVPRLCRERMRAYIG